MLKEFVDSCAEHIDVFFENILQYVDKISGIVGGLCGLAALLYIGSKVWGNYSRGESIEIYPLLRPFVIGLLCANFNVVVVGGIRGLADPVCEYFQGLQKESDISDMNAKFAQSVDYAREKVATMEKAIPADDDSGPGWLKRAWQKIKNWLFLGLAWLIGWIADLLAALTKFVLIFTRCFSLSILCLLGPLVFAISIFPGYKQGLNQWIARFVCIYMWMPLFSLCDIFINTVSSGIGNVLLNNINQLIDGAVSANGEVDAEMVKMAAFRLQGLSANIAVITAMISILAASLYKSVPTLASWIIAGGDASGQLSSIAGFANNAALGIGKIASVAGGAAALAGAKGAGLLMREGGSAAGGQLAKAGSKIAGGGGGGAAPGGNASLGAGPLDAPARQPMGFKSSSTSASVTAVAGGAVPLSMPSLAGSGTPMSSESAGKSPERISSLSDKMRHLTGSTLQFAGRQLRRPQLAHMMRYGNERERYHAVKDPYATKGIIKKGLKDGNIFVQQAALGNARTAQSTRLLKRAAKYGFEDVANQAASMLSDLKGGQNSVQQVFNVPVSTSGNAGIATLSRGSLTGSTSTMATGSGSKKGGKKESAEMLKKPAAASPKFIETASASRQRVTEPASETPESVSKLRRLTGSTLQFVGRQLRRPQLAHMMRYGNERERYHAVKDPYATKGIIKKGLKDGNIFVQQAALGNARTAQSARLLKRAAKYGYEDVANQAAAMLSELKQNKNNEQNDVNQQ